MDQAAFDAGRQNVSFEGGRMTQGGHLVFAGPEDDARAGMPELRERLEGGRGRVRVHASAAGQRRVFRFAMPAVPTALDQADVVEEIAGASYDDYRGEDDQLSGGRRSAARERFFVADPKVMNTFRTSLVNDLIAREMNEDGRVYQRVNRIHYNYFWVRDGSYFVRTYDMLGLHDLARETLNAFLVWQDDKPTGFFRPKAPQPPGARLSVQDDYWGQVLWAFGAHIRTTGDRALLEQIYPLLGPHVDEFVAKCASDPRGLWPVAGPYDNEEINGHYTGHSFWALLGLKYAVFMAKAMDRPADAAKWQKIHDDYEANFLKQLRELAAKSDGYIPPGMDTRDRRQRLGERQWRALPVRGPVERRPARAGARWRSCATTTTRKAS